ncbi:cation transporter [Pseudonocardiaceae bacterium YIM PH 21723]|nr:cation transporter [Pseudonocardiaceae bacterium YIM PH 21723]
MKETSGRRNEQSREIPVETAHPASGRPRRGTSHGHGHSHGHDHGHGHSHGHVTENTDRTWLRAALILLSLFMAVEATVGFLAHSLALISDAGHMLTDAASIVLALVAIRIAARPAGGRYTYGWRRFEILSAQANGLVLILLAGWFGIEGVQRLISTSPVHGQVVTVTAIAGVVVNVIVVWLMGKANRDSLNVEGAYQHVLNDLFAFLCTAVSGAVVWLTGFSRADAIAALVVAALMAVAGARLLRDSTRVFLEAAPRHLDPDEIGSEIAALPDVVEVHDLHVWGSSVTDASLSAHVLVSRNGDCLETRVAIDALLGSRYGISHTTLQVEQAAGPLAHCTDAHGPVHRAKAS